MPEPKLKSENYTNLGGINTKVSEYITGDFQFLDLKNYTFERPGSLTKRTGFTQYVGATVTGRFTGVYEFEKLDGSSYVIAAANTNAYDVTTGSFNPIKTGLTANALFDFETYVDRLFAANGAQFFKYDGSNVTNFSLPRPDAAPVGFTLGFTGTVSGFSGVFQYAIAYKNDIGYIGPVSPEDSVGVSGQAVVLSGFTTPADFGISSILIYRTGNGLGDLFLLDEIPAGSSLYVDSNSATLSTEPPNDNLFFTLVPKYLELYNNQMFFAGASSQLSTVYFSDIGIPESIAPEYFFEVRTNDGDRVTGMRSYQGFLLIFKERSCHILSGDNPDNFLLREISDQYGCISNRSIVTFEDRCFFLDRKGVVEYNGANIRVVSNAVENDFLRINLSAARENATAIHNRLRNEVWFSIPVDGAEENNLTLVYDYVVNAWTTFDGFSVSSIASVRSRFERETLLYGGYSGALFNFGSSIFGDNGQGFTALMKTRFIKPLGNSTTEQFRRLYIDQDAIQGTTSPFEVEFFKDYEDTPVLQRQMFQSEFQSRIDYGIPAKAISFKISNSSTLPIRVNGFTVESRLQRRV